MSGITIISSLKSKIIVVSMKYYNQNQQKFLKWGVTSLNITLSATPFNLMSSVLQAWISSISPYQFSFLGIACSMALSILGAGIGIYMIGASLTQATVHHPEIKSKNLISILFCEAIALYGIILSIIMYTSIPSAQASFIYRTAGYQGPQRFDRTILEKEVKNSNAGFGQGFGGFSVGFANVFAAVTVGVLGSSLVVANANSATIFVKLFISEVFAEAIALIGLICGIVMSTGVSYA